MLIAEDLALLLPEGDTGASGTATPRGEYSLAGALLIELALLDRVDVTGGTDPVDTAPRTPAPDGTGGTDGSGGTDGFVSTDGTGGANGAGAPEAPTTGRLVLRDPAPTGHPALDSALAVLATLEDARPKDAVEALTKEPVSTDLRSAPGKGAAELDRLRARLREVLVDGREPDERTTALIALLTGTDAVGAALGPDAAGDVE
ncbi:GPP34 family phosphoprotein, partial [Saccharomonospora iraqiensis]|uniref:GPP34 family phosphoprotein n=1 Tax=Saccharomonospora iraqiensis TaxID=52698 RepID=UPI00047D7EC1